MQSRLSHTRTHPECGPGCGVPQGDHAVAVRGDQLAPTEGTVAQTGQLGGGGQLEDGPWERQAGRVRGLAPGVCARVWAAGRGGGAGRAWRLGAGVLEGGCLGFVGGGGDRGEVVDVDSLGHAWTQGGGERGAVWLGCERLAVEGRVGS